VFPVEILHREALHSQGKEYRKKRDIMKGMKKHVSEEEDRSTLYRKRRKEKKKRKEVPKTI
jgi:hypothetical protein